MAKLWTEDELIYLREYYPDATWDTIEATLRNRTRSAIRTKAFDLGIKRNRTPRATYPITRWQREAIKELASSLPIKELSVLVLLPVHEVRLIARRLGATLLEEVTDADSSE